MPDPIRLHCLGAPALYLPDGSVLRFRVRKHLALLVFLAMEPRTHRRDRLAELLWPGVSGREGRHSLATALSVLRAKLGRSVIEAARDTVRLAAGAIELDLDRLAAGEVLGSDVVPPLAVAPLLEEFDIADAPDWGQWRDGQAARWQPAIRDALLALIDRSRRHGDTRAMERLADSLLAIDPLSEEGIRSKMEARAFAGDRLSALKVFEEWKERLADEVGAQPGELVEGMAVRLRRRGWERTGQQHIAPVHTDQWKGRPFVGRAREYRQLYEGWEGCQRGASRHVILTGDSGVGKSTLAERLTTAAGLQGAVSGREQCHEVERDVPYAAMGGLAVGLLDKPGATAIAPEWLGELGRVVSEVKRRFPNAPPPLEAEGETVRIRIADAFAELAIAVAEEQPLVLILDDLHLADDASVAVLHHLLRRVEEHRVLVLLTARPGEIASGGNAQRLLERGEQVGLGTVRVPPLTSEEAEELLESLVTAQTPGSPAPAVRRALLQAAAGYPMVLELLVDDWQMHADQCLALTLGGMTERAVEQNPGEVYGRLLDRLSGALEPTSRNVLNLASVLGSRLNDFSLYGLVDLTLAETMAGLSRLTAMRILRDAGEGLEFINELMRAQAYVMVPSSVRRVLHSKVADVLIERVEGGEGMLRLEIAWHCVRARRKEESARYLIAGADEAIEQGAHVDAERALMTAIPNLSADVQAEAQYRLALVLQDQGQWEESATLLRRFDMAVVPSELADDVVAAKAIAGIATAWARASGSRSEILDLVKIVSCHRSVALRIRAANQIASYVTNTNDREPIEPTLAALAAIDATTLTQHEAGAIAIAKAQLNWPLREFTSITNLLTEADRSAQAIAPDGMLALRAALGRGITLAASGYYEAATPHLERALHIAIRIGNDGIAGNSLATMAMCQQRLGHYESSILLARRALKQTRSPEPPTFALACRFYITFAQALLARRDEAMDSWKDAAAFATEYPGTWISQAWSFWGADALWLLGERERAARLAMSELQGSNPVLMEMGLAGPFCRWYAVLAGRDARRPGLDNLLRQQVCAAHARDAVDRLEIAAAATSPTGREILSPEEVQVAISAIPHHVPHATLAQLQALGLATSHLVA